MSSNVIVNTVAREKPIITVLSVVVTDLGLRGGRWVLALLSNLPSVIVLFLLLNIMRDGPRTPSPISATVNDFLFTCFSVIKEHINSF